jgi:integrase
MEQTFERVEKHLYKRQYQTASGDWSTIFYARFTDWKGKRRTFPLGSELKTARGELKVLEARNVRREDFDLDRQVKPEPEGMTVARWSRIYLDMEETKSKRSYERECQHVDRLNRFFGSMLLTELKREHLFQYRKQRLDEHIVRYGKPAKTKVSTGTVANELSCLRHMLRVAARESVEVSIPSFDGLVVRSEGRERVLDADEETALLEAYPAWMKRISIVSRETCLSEGDVIRLTEDMIDRKNRVIVPEGGRVKTGVKQASPITNAVLEVLDEIRRGKKSGAIVRNINGLVFTREDGRAITKDMITAAVKTARKRTGVKDFRFHDYRHMAMTSWTLQNIHVDAAMLAAGHKSVQMHKRYVNLKPADVATAFGLLQSDKKWLQGGNMKDGTSNEAS